MKPLSVAELNAQIKAYMEATFTQVAVEGEISNFTAHTSGHWYFSLKDESSTVRCVMFRGNNARVKFRPANGQKVLLTGGLSVYAPRGEYQVIVATMEPAGIGSLMLAFEQLKAKLEAAGWFDPAHKKPLPRYPRRIALITSATGAAIEDMKRVAAKRWPLVRLELYNTLVQGEQAAAMIAQRLREADAGGYDLLVIGRGGGSIEDLWAFNDEELARAVYEARTPVISAVGHEVDFVITDFVADLRAPTPSAAMEAALPDRTEVLIALDELHERFGRRMADLIEARVREGRHLAEALQSRSPQVRLHNAAIQIEGLARSLAEAFGRINADAAARLLPMAAMFGRAIEGRLERARYEVAALTEALEAQEPSRRVARGFAQVSLEGRAAALEVLCVGQEIELCDAQMLVHAEVKAKRSL